MKINWLNFLLYFDFISAFKEENVMYAIFLYMSAYTPYTISRYVEYSNFIKINCLSRYHEVVVLSSNYIATDQASVLLMPTPVLSY